jgi:hypothetical protein
MDGIGMEQSSKVIDAAPFTGDLRCPAPCRWCRNRADPTIQHRFLPVYKSDGAEHLHRAVIGPECHQHDVPPCPDTPLSENPNLHRRSKAVLEHPRGKRKSFALAAQELSQLPDRHGWIVLYRSRRPARNRHRKTPAAAHSGPLIKPNQLDVRATQDPTQENRLLGTSRLGAGIPCWMSGFPRVRFGGRFCFQQGASAQSLDPTYGTNRSSDCHSA